jgi:hypothetical protein
LQRLFLAANPSIELFWQSTFEEVLLTIQGLVDRQRIERRNSYNLYCAWTEKPISIFDYSPLPYDEELKEVTNDQGMTDAEIYALVKAANANFDIPIIFNGR